ncbi:DMT family transporter [Amycolatopsis alkalitolerans]|uniref:DMT family transporter n=1 Tax=Amycolatopsis alkalitolerans TaxID=2547244 RepID=UPI00190F2C8C|nr:DMT family transporter [Amycolatopsis alkalitolerans]
MTAEWSSTAVAVPAAVLGAALMGLASAAQAKATKQVPQGKTLHPGLLVDLAHRPLWLVGIVATIGGLLLQVLALGFGPLLLVQPLLVTALPFAAAFSAWLGHRRPDGVVVLGALVCVAGLAGFLALAQPTGGANELVSDVGPLAVVLGLIALLGLGLSTVLRGAGRVLGLALATGVFYGVTAGLMKVVAGQLREGAAVPFSHWALYVVCVVGPIGFLLSQNTFQQGRAMAPALAVITTADPMVGVAIGIGWMGESAMDGTAVLAGEIAAAAVIVAGIWILSHRSSHLLAPAPTPAAGSRAHPSQPVPSQ